MLLHERDAPAGVQADPAFLRDVLTGLSLPQKAIPPRWFYDRRGSELFEQITRLPEYYPTRIETALLRSIADEIGQAVGAGRAVVEFGAGSAAKTPHLLAAIHPAAYVPIDISGDYLRESSAALAAVFPGLPVLPVEGDFLHEVSLPSAIKDLKKLGFFPGSTIGNMGPFEAVNLLRIMRGSLGEGAALLIGMDRIKDPAILIPAYDDAAGVTAAFNRNLLERINRELDGTIPLDRFTHVAIWNDPAARIEMHLQAREDICFTVAGHAFAMAKDETIHSENSHKYGLRDARLLLDAGGWTPLRLWTDPDEMFTLILAEAPPEAIAGSA